MIPVCFSIAAGKLLDVEDYILLPAQKKGTLVSAFRAKSADGGISTQSSRHNRVSCNSDGFLDLREESRILDARDPHFLEEYYAR